MASNFIPPQTDSLRYDPRSMGMAASSVIQVSAMIGNLRNMASDMNGELENQNQQLDRINLKATSDITRVKMANDKAAALMK